MVQNSTWLGSGWHNFRLSLNGTVLTTAARIGADNLTVIAEVDAAAVPTLSTNNILLLERTGGSDLTPSGAVPWTWIGLDYLSLEADPAALDDADGDGLPAWWERAYLRSPAVSNAAADPDRDGLTDAREFSNATNPDVADTDGDGLSDGAERLAAPLSNPLLADSDADGLPDAAEKSATPATNPTAADSDGDGDGDAWEKQTRTNPNLASSLPPIFSQALGLDFVSRNAGTSAPGPWEVAGVMPQPFWNHVFPAARYAASIGTMNQIAGPDAGALVTSAGTASPVTATWSSPYATTSGCTGSPDGKLLEGFLAADAATPAIITLTNIPFAIYDVIAYVGAASDQSRGTVELAGTPATRRFFLADSAAPFRSFKEATTTQAEMDSAVGGTTIPEEINRRKQAACRSGNFVRFRNVTGTSVTVQVRQEYSGAGLCAIQIVDAAADRDGDGMTDAYEDVSAKSSRMLLQLQISRIYLALN